MEYFILLLDYFTIFVMQTCDYMRNLDLNKKL